MRKKPLITKFRLTLLFAICLLLGIPSHSQQDAATDKPMAGTMSASRPEQKGMDKMTGMPAMTGMSGMPMQANFGNWPAKSRRMVIGP